MYALTHHRLDLVTSSFRFSPCMSWGPSSTPYSIGAARGFACSSPLTEADDSGDANQGPAGTRVGRRLDLPRSARAGAPQSHRPLVVQEVTSKRWAGRRCAETSSGPMAEEWFRVPIRAKRASRPARHCIATTRSLCSDPGVARRFMDGRPVQDRLDRPHPPARKTCNWVPANTP